MSDSTTVFYRTRETGGHIRHEGDFHVVEGGVILIYTSLSCSFIPFNRIVSIEQEQDPDLDLGVRLENSLINVMRRR